MRALLVAFIFTMVAGQASAMDFSNIQLSFNSHSEINDWGFMCKGFRCSLQPMNEDVVDTLDSLDKTKAYKCNAKVRQNRFSNNWAVHSLFELRDCRLF